MTSNYLADKLGFRKKYEKKIYISPLFVDKITVNEKKVNFNYINLLTISSSNFLQKWLWVFELAKQILQIKDVKINWKIVLPWDKKNKKIILDKINSLPINSNINIEIYDFIERTNLVELYKNSDIFVYASGLDTWWWVIMEACTYWKPIILLENDLWDYIYPKEFVTLNFENKFFEILKNYNFYSKISYTFSEKFLKDKIMKDFLLIIKE